MATALVEVKRYAIGDYAVTILQRCDETFPHGPYGGSKIKRRPEYLGYVYGTWPHWGPNGGYQPDNHAARGVWQQPPGQYASSPEDIAAIAEATIARHVHP